MDIRIAFEGYRQEHKAEGRRLRYPGALRRRAVAHMQERRAHGATMPQIARELGVQKGALYRWQAEEQPASRPAAALRPVQVMAAAKPPPALLIRGPRGIVVEGLDIEGLAELLKKVGE